MAVSAPQPWTASTMSRGPSASLSTPPPRKSSAASNLSVASPSVNGAAVNSRGGGGSQEMARCDSRAGSISTLWSSADVPFLLDSRLSRAGSLAPDVVSARASLAGDLISIAGSHVGVSTAGSGGGSVAPASPPLMRRDLSEGSLFDPRIIEDVLQSGAEKGGGAEGQWQSHAWADSGPGQTWRTTPLPTPRPSPFARRMSDSQSAASNSSVTMPPLVRSGSPSSSERDSAVGHFPPTPQTPIVDLPLQETRSSGARQAKDRGAPNVPVAGVTLQDAAYLDKRTRLQKRKPDDLHVATSATCSATSSSPRPSASPSSPSPPRASPSASRRKNKTRSSKVGASKDADRDGTRRYQDAVLYAQARRYFDPDYSMSGALLSPAKLSKSEAQPAAANGMSQVERRWSQAAGSNHPGELIGASSIAPMTERHAKDTTAPPPDEREEHDGTDTHAAAHTPGRTQPQGPALAPRSAMGDDAKAAQEAAEAVQAKNDNVKNVTRQHSSLQGVDSCASGSPVIMPIDAGQGTPELASSRRPSFGARLRMTSTSRLRPRLSSRHLLSSADGPLPSTQTAGRLRSRTLGDADRRPSTSDATTPSVPAMRVLGTGPATNSASVGGPPADAATGAATKLRRPSSTDFASTSAMFARLRRPSRTETLSSSVTSSTSASRLNMPLTSSHIGAKRGSSSGGIMFPSLAASSSSLLGHAGGPSTTSASRPKSKSGWASHLADGLTLHFDLDGKRAALRLGYLYYDPFGRAHSLCSQPDAAAAAAGASSPSSGAGTATAPDGDGAGRPGTPRRPRSKSGFGSMLGVGSSLGVHARDNSAGVSSTQARHEHDMASTPPSAEEQTGILEFGLSSLPPSHSPSTPTCFVCAQGVSPVLRHLTIGGDDTKADLITRQASLSTKLHGTHEVSGWEKKGRLAWRFVYDVEDAAGRGELVAGQVPAGAKLVRPVSFSCSATLLDPAKARKGRLLNMVRKQILTQPIASVPVAGFGSSSAAQLVPHISGSGSMPCHDAAPNGQGRPGSIAGSEEGSTASSNSSRNARHSNPNDANLARPTAASGMTVPYGSSPRAGHFWNGSATLHEHAQLVSSTDAARERGSSGSTEHNGAGSSQQSPPRVPLHLPPNVVPFRMNRQEMLARVRQGDLSPIKSSVCASQRSTTAGSSHGGGGRSSGNGSGSTASGSAPASARLPGAAGSLTASHSYGSSLALPSPSPTSPTFSPSMLRHQLSVTQIVDASMPSPRPTPSGLVGYARMSSGLQMRRRSNSTGVVEALGQQPQASVDATAPSSRRLKTPTEAPEAAAQRREVLQSSPTAGTDEHGRQRSFCRGTTSTQTLPAQHAHRADGPTGRRRAAREQDRPPTASEEIKAAYLAKSVTDTDRRRRLHTAPGGAEGAVARLAATATTTATTTTRMMTASSAAEQIGELVTFVRTDVSPKTKMLPLRALSPASPRPMTADATLPTNLAATPPSTKLSSTQRLHHQQQQQQQQQRQHQQPADTNKRLPPLPPPSRKSSKVGLAMASTLPRLIGSRSRLASSGSGEASASQKPSPPSPPSSKQQQQQQRERHERAKADKLFASLQEQGWL